eukprot:TRINITY_DN0_c660_g2_i1.p2 TRINITY_DN0_c660_g2~~TRINITY_DN0_c660_g2_i1.p2  ORF type:complete len:110 (+),score=18.45 TRINITY_DN0_c660_g2_i1:76-405(+)
MAKTSTDPSIVFIGTDVCLAPELAMSGEATKATDIWAFGMVMYFIIFGMNFLECPGNSAKAVWTGIVKLPKDAVDPDMIQLMLTCLNSRPNLRPSTDKLYEAMKEIIKE